MYSDLTNIPPAPSDNQNAPMMDSSMGEVRASYSEVTTNKLSHLIPNPFDSQSIALSTHDPSSHELLEGIFSLSIEEKH